MTQEDKAKAYDIALDKIKRLLGTCSNCSREELEYVFPELKESEDEKIRKEIIELVMQPTWKTEKEFNRRNELCEWLEKQGKTSPVFSNSSNIGKVEPKFKFGDWVVVNDGRIGRIIECTKYFADVDLEFSCLSTSPNNIRSWTIQDAKAGDVIYSRHNTESFEWIGIFKSLDKENKRVFFYGFWHDMAKTFSACRNDAYVLYDDFSPASKEQRDLLFQKMKDAGYTFDFEKKELKKIEPQPTEDRYMEGYLNGINDTLKPAAWSEEDEAVLDAITRRLEGENIYVSPHLAVKFLKSLKDRVQPQPKQEWSKEDRETIDYLIDYLESELDSSYTKEDKEEFTKEIELLKSLRPQNTWKPSDEQISVLEFVMEDIEKDSIRYAVLNSVLEQLKKLRE